MRCSHKLECFRTQPALSMAQQETRKLPACIRVRQFSSGKGPLLFCSRLSLLSLSLDVFASRISPHHSPIPPSTPLPWHFLVLVLVKSQPIALAEPHLCSFIPFTPASSQLNILSVYDEQYIEHYSSRLSAQFQDTLFYTQLFQAGNWSSSRFFFFNLF